MPRRKRPTELPTPSPVEPPVVPAPPVNPMPPPEPPSGDGRIDINTPWRTIGSIERATWERLLRSAGSPMVDDLDAIIAASGPYNALALNMAYKESSLGKDATARQTNNPLGIMAVGNEPYVWTGAGRKLRKFGAWPDAFASFADRLGGSVYAKTRTLAELIERYVMGWQPDTPASQRVYSPQTASKAQLDEYKTQTVQRLNGWGASVGVPPAPKPQPLPTPPIDTRKEYMVAGLGKPIRLSFPLIVQLMPTSQKNQRPGTPMRAVYYTQHETANPTRGAGARMHWQYMASGAPDGNGRPQQLGYHLTVDDGVAYQMIPVDEVTWHAGDGGGQGNMASVACELCINSDADLARARRNAEELAAEVMAALGIPVANLRQHNAWSGKDCPMLIRHQGYWQTFVANVTRRMTGAAPAPAPPSMPVPRPIPKTWDGTPYVDPAGRVFPAVKYAAQTARPGVVGRLWAGADQPAVTGALPANTELAVEYLTPDQQWVVTQYGTRFAMLDIVPRVKVADIPQEDDE
jgi:hypothetical protein